MSMNTEEMLKFLVDTFERVQLDLFEGAYTVTLDLIPTGREYEENGIPINSHAYYGKQMHTAVREAYLYTLRELEEGKLKRWR